MHNPCSDRAFVSGKVALSDQILGNFYHYRDPVFSLLFASVRKAYCRWGWMPFSCRNVTRDVHPSSLGGTGGGVLVTCSISLVGDCDSPDRIGSLAEMGCPAARLGRHSKSNCRARWWVDSPAIDNINSRRSSKVPDWRTLYNSHRSPFVTIAYLTPCPVQYSIALRTTVSSKFVPKDLASTIEMGRSFPIRA